MLRIGKGQRVVLPGIIIASALILGRLKILPGLADALMIAAAVIAGYPIVANAIRALKYKILGIDALVTLAVTGAIFINEYWEAAAVTFLFMLGNYLESRTLEKTRSAIKSLLELAPDFARVIRDGQELMLSLDDVAKGDVIIAKPGEKIPVDGIVTEGNAYVNQATITGESMPVNRETGDGVFAGTVIEAGYLIVKAERIGEDTTFSRILQMVEEAQDKKAKTQKFLEVFSKYYTPSIMLLAVIVFAVTRDIELSLTLLVIACPGALVISTPVSIVAGIGNGAKHGVLIKGGEIIEKLGTIKVLAFDKTGTLTEGKPRVTDIKGYGVVEDEVLRLTASAERYSEHPLAKAILERANINLGNNLIEPRESELISGQGLRAKLEDKIILVGNRKLMSENGILIPEEIEEYLNNEEAEGKTAVITSDLDRVIGVISIADTIRKDVHILVKRLKRLGVKRVVMLTGDNSGSAAAIAKKAGLDGYYAELMPEDKVSILKGLQEEYGTAGMVGDGINDAPALASADLGIAVGEAGTDVAMETADVVLMSDEINKLSYAIGLSRATVINMKQNIYFAIIIVGMLLLGVLFRFVFLSFGMLVHEMSVLVVIVNAIRLLKYREKT